MLDSKLVSIPLQKTPKLTLHGGDPLPGAAQYPQPWIASNILFSRDLTSPTQPSFSIYA